MRKLFIPILLFTIFIIVSCEKSITEEYSMPEMKAFYQESITLPSVTTDSVKRFVDKVNAFTAEEPEAVNDPLYPKIVENIKMSNLRLVITIDTTWAGTTYIKF